PSHFPLRSFGFHKQLVPAAGVEPATFRSGGERSNPLSYAGMADEKDTTGTQVRTRRGELRIADFGLRICTWPTLTVYAKSKRFKTSDHTNPKSAIYNPFSVAGEESTAGSRKRLPRLKMQLG